MSINITLPSLYEQRMEKGYSIITELNIFHLLRATTSNLNSTENVPLVF